MHDADSCPKRGPRSNRRSSVRRRTFAAPNWRIAETAGWLGETLAREGRRAEALPLLQESADTFHDAVRRRQPAHRRRPGPARPVRSRPDHRPLRVFWHVFRHLWRRAGFVPPGSRRGL